MLKRVIIATLLLCLSLAILLLAGCEGCDEVSPAESESLSVTLYSQETGMWCWAASAQMVMDYLGQSVSQCTQANNRYGRTDCCTIDLCPPPTEPICGTAGGHECACGGWPEFDKYGFTFSKTTNAALSWEDLKTQISDTVNCNGAPFCFTWHYDGGGGHVMVVIGYKTVSGVNMVEILDPWSPCAGDRSFIPYDTYVSGNYFTHWDDYYNVKPAVP